MAEFSEVIHFDESKDRPKDTSSSVELFRLFGELNLFVHSDALVNF